MGQAKRRLKHMQQEQPWCVYCGQTTPGTSVDHMPPITIFDNRRRRREWSISHAKLVTQVAGHSIYSRASSAACIPTQTLQRHVKKLPKHSADFETITRHCLTNWSPRQNKKRKHSRPSRRFQTLGGALAIGPGMRTLLAQFAGRVGLALHYELCRQIVPPSGAVLVRIFTNASLIDGEFPTDFVDMLGAPQTLRQGSMSVEDQFNYASRALEDMSMSAHIATFRMSFAVQAFVARDSSALSPPPNWATRLT